MIAAEEYLALIRSYAARWEAALAADATTLDEYNQPGIVWSADAYGWVAEPAQPVELIECADGRKRTAAERAAWLDAIHASIRDAATS